MNPFFWGRWSLKKIMRNFRKIGKLISSVPIFFILASEIFAQSLAQIQIAVATPDPAKAGESVTFQIILINNETEPWSAADVKCGIEIFDSAGNYIQKTQPEGLSSDAAPGGSALFLVSFRIPETYSGRYQYRIMLDKKGQNILTSDFYEFNVKASAVEKKEEKPYYLSGNAAVSYKDTKIGNSQTSLSANILGRLGQKTMIFNSNAYSTPDDMLDLDTVYLSVFADRYKFSMGDVMPDYSPLSIYSLAGRGANVNYKLRRFELSGCYLITQKASEGSVSTNGSYERWTAGTSARVFLPADIKFKVTGAVTEDDKNSIDNPGPSNEAVSSIITAAELDWAAGTFLKMKGEYALGSNKKEASLPSGKYENAASTAAKAVRFETGLYGKKFNLKAKYQKVDPGFLNGSNPGIYPDRKGVETSFNYYPFSLISVNAGFQTSSDNLGNDPSVVTTNQKITQYGMQLTPKGLPSLSFSSNLNDVTGSSVTIINNDTKGMSYGLSYYFWGQMISANFSVSKFRNHASTATGQDVDSDGLSLTYSGKISAAISVDGGYTASNSENLYNRAKDRVTSASLGSNIKIRERMNLFLYGSKTKRESPNANDSSLKDWTDTLNGSLELTYKAKQNLSLTCGGTYEKQDETGAAPDDYTSPGVIFRMHYSF